MSTLPLLASIALVGIGATALLDLWLWLLRRLGLPTGSLMLIGRWVAHAAHGRVMHPSIAAAAPVRHEGALGWAVHYAVGIAFATLPVLLQGPGWVREPAVGTAVLCGIATVVMPWFVMQPAMGLGIASSKTSAPWAHALRSLANHAVFGLGLYLAAALLARLAA